MLASTSTCSWRLGARLIFIASADSSGLARLNRCGFMRVTTIDDDMELGFHANICDATTERIADALRAPFKVISQDLSGDYGGTMNHLWIDFELVEAFAQRRRPWSFRFQKKVGGSSPNKLTGLPRRVHENVGHYSVRPDFKELRNVPQDSVVSYVLSLITLPPQCSSRSRRSWEDLTPRSFVRRLLFRAGSMATRFRFQGSSFGIRQP